MEAFFPMLKMWAMVTLLSVTAGSPEPAGRCPSETAGDGGGGTGSGSGEVSIKTKVYEEGVELSPSAIAEAAIADDLAFAMPTGKRWLDDFAAYSNENPRKSYVVGRSRTISLSAQEAKERACRDAARQLFAIMRPYVADDFVRRQGQQWIVEDLTRRLVSPSGRFVVDRYTDHTQKQYGTLWSHAVLVEVSQPRLTGVAMEYNAMARERQIAPGRMIASIGGLAALIVLTYAGVNAWTKGYFRGRLRAGAVVAMIAGASVVMWAHRVHRDRGLPPAVIVTHDANAQDDLAP
jgi:hypothetical protein